MNTRSVNSAAGVIIAAMQQKQTAAGIALALEAAGLLMSPEAAAEIASVSVDAVALLDQAVAELKREHEESARLRNELAAYQTLELGDLDGRVSAACGNPAHPTWLRAVGDSRGCPSCELDEAHEALIGANLSLHEEELETARLRLALDSAQRGRREQRARVAELETERHSTNEALADMTAALRPVAPLGGVS